MPASITLSKDENLTTDTVHESRRSLLEWIQLSVPGQRSRTLLPSLPTDTLCWGLKWLRNHISHLVDQDNKLYREFLSLLPEAERAARGTSYSGWYWRSPPEDTIDGMTRMELLGFLRADVGVYDEVWSCVRYWRKEIERLQKEKVSGRPDLKEPVVDREAN